MNSHLSARNGAVALLATAALTLTGCSSSSNDEPATSPVSSASTRATTTNTQTPKSVSPSTGPLLRTTKVTGEDTVIAFDKKFVKALYTRGINTRATGTAGLDDYHRTRFPISGGSATIFAGSAGLSRSTASLEHANCGLVVSDRTRRVTVSDITVTLGRAPTISAVVDRQSTDGRGGARMTLFDLTLSKPASKGSGGTTVGSIRATLDPTLAKLLDRVFGNTVFSDYGSKSVGTVTLTLTS